jgi:hypothetical protein
LVCCIGEGNYLVGKSELKFWLKAIFAGKHRQMSKLIKCSKCQTWDENQDYCTNCNQLLSLDIEREQELEKLHQEEQQRPLTKFANYLLKLKHSDHPIDRVKYAVLNSAWLLFLLFVAGLIALVALAPG